MLTIIIILIISALLVGSGITIYSMSHQGTSSIAAKVSLSEVGAQVVKEYNSLPVENRPFPNIVSLVKELDERTSVNPENRRRHFDSNWLPQIRCQNGPFKFSWSTRACCNHNRCDYLDYYRLHRAIAAVSKSLDDKNQAMLESRTQPSLDMIRELETQLRAEAELNRNFVREYKELS